MKKKMITITVIAVALLVGTSSVLAYADYLSPAEIYAKLKGITVEEAYEQRNTGAPYGQLAEEEGLGDQFREEMIENKKGLIQERVEDGIITQEQADIIIERIEKNVASCDGTCYRSGPRMGAGFGRSYGGRGGCGGFGKGNKGGFGRGSRFNN